MTYKYRCEKGCEWFREQRITEEPDHQCPSCCGDARRVPFTAEEANGAFVIHGYSESNGYS